MEYFRTAHIAYMKFLSILWSIFKGHEHILGDKIAKFEARALATLHLGYSVEFQAQYVSIRHMQSTYSYSRRS
jgi:hypothetical protein